MDSTSKDTSSLNSACKHCSSLISYNSKSSSNLRTHLKVSIIIAMTLLNYLPFFSSNEDEKYKIKIK